MKITIRDGAVYVKTDDILKDMCGIIESSRKIAYQAVNTALVHRNWLLGYRIASEELQGEKRAEYGTEVIKKLSQELTKDYGKGFDYSSLYKFVRFYKAFPDILDSASPKSTQLLSWTHYRALLQVEDETARAWYHLCCRLKMLTLKFSLQEQSMMNTNMRE